LTRSVAAFAAPATGLLLEFVRFELGRELVWLDAREPDERDEEARLLALELDPLLRLFVVRELPRAAPEPPLLDRVEPDRRDELERLVVVDFLVCWGI
jgi:hypothetical protein